MKLKTTMTQGEIPRLVKDSETGDMVPNPDYTLICKSGHSVPHGTRMFSVGGKVVPPERVGVYCEHCLSIANRINVLNRRGIPVTFNLAEELNKLIEESKQDG